MAILIINWVNNEMTTIEILGMPLFRLIILFLVIVIILTIAQTVFGARVFEMIGTMDQEPAFLNVTFVICYILLLIFHTARLLLDVGDYTPTVFWIYVCRMMADVLILLTVHAWIFFVSRAPGKDLVFLPDVLPENSFEGELIKVGNRLHWKMYSKNSADQASEKTAGQDSQTPEGQSDKQTEGKASKNKTSINWYFVIFAGLWWGAWIIWLRFFLFLNSNGIDYCNIWTSIGCVITGVLVFVSIALNCESYYLSFTYSYFYHLISRSDDATAKYNKAVPSATTWLNKLIYAVTSNAKCFLFTTLIYTVAVGLLLFPSVIGYQESGSASKETTFVEVSLSSSSTSNIPEGNSEDTENKSSVKDNKPIVIKKRALEDIALFYIIVFLLFVGFFSFLVIYHVPRAFLNHIHRKWVYKELDDLERKFDLLETEKRDDQKMRRLYEDRLNMPKTYEVYLITAITVIIQILGLVIAYLKAK